MPRAARQEEDDEEEIQEVTDFLAAVTAISMGTLASEPGCVFMFKEKRKQHPEAFSLRKVSSRV